LEEDETCPVNADDKADLCAICDAPVAEVHPETGAGYCSNCWNEHRP
jgi:hypothetical protein